MTLNMAKLLGPSVTSISNHLKFPFWLFAYFPKCAILGPVLRPLVDPLGSGFTWFRRCGEKVWRPPFEYFGSKHFFQICTQFGRFLSVGSVSISISNCFDESFERRILSESPSLQSRRFLLLFSAGLPTLPLAHATVTSRKNRAQIFLFLDPPATEDPIFFCILLEENVHTHVGNMLCQQ